MNSTLQQLYMIPTFRKAIMDVEDLQYKTTPREDNILYQLKVTSLKKNNVKLKSLSSVYSMLYLIVKNNI